MEDRVEEGADPTPDDLAIIEPTDADDPSSQPDGGDVPADGESAEGTETPEGEQPTGDELETPEDPVDPDADKRVPYSRFREVVEQRNDIKEQNKTLLTILAQQGIGPDGKKATESERKQATADLSKYTPKQIEEAKALLGTVLKDELGLVGTLSEQVKSLKESQDRDKAERERQAREKFAQEDEQQMVSAIKDFKGEFTKKEVEAQILKWDGSGNPQLKSLARAPYSVILREMQRMKGARKAIKPKAAPKPPSGGGGDEGSRLPRPGNNSKRTRPDPSNPDAWMQGLAKEVVRRVSDGTEEE